MGNTCSQDLLWMLQDEFGFQYYRWVEYILNLVIFQISHPIWVNSKRNSHYFQYRQVTLIFALNLDELLMSQASGYQVPRAEDVGILIAMICYFQYSPGKLPCGQVYPLDGMYTDLIFRLDISST